MKGTISNNFGKFKSMEASILCFLMKKLHNILNASLELTMS